MKWPATRPHLLHDAIFAVRIVLPSVAALLAGLGLAQFAPTVSAAANPARPIVKPHPMLAATAPYPERYTITKTMKFASPIQFGDWVWDETNAPLGGPVLITVDLKAETLSVFRSGHQIGMTRMIYGDDDKPTPTGIFPITQKSEKHRSNIFVDAPMPYMLRMTNDGISVHGADKVMPIYATNGCIGVPTEFAKRLFEVASLGDRIVVTKAKELRSGAVVPTA